MAGEALKCWRELVTFEGLGLKRTGGDDNLPHHGNAIYFWRCAAADDFVLCAGMGAYLASSQTTWAGVVHVVCGGAEFSAAI